MRKLIFFIPLISISVLIFMIGAALIKQNNFNDKKTVKSVFIDKHFPKESIRLLNSSQIINLNNFKGSSFLVNFFSSWCEPCKLEAENLEKLSDKINIIGIAYKDKSDDISKFLNNFGNPYQTIGIDPNGEIAINWGVYGVPETFLINKNGKVVFRHAGPITNSVLSSEILPKIEEAVNE